jgi:tRNA(fMet)-specific endonuclease VapC
MKYALDTDTCSYILRGTPSVRERLAAVAAHDISVSVVTLAEAWTGCRKSSHADKWLKAWRHLVEPFQVLDFDSQCADLYSRIRARLERKGTMIGGNDCMIAATALANEVTLVTHNTAEFRRVPGLRVVDWVSEA